MPNWDVDLAAPVANRTYSLGEIISKDTSILGVSPGGTQMMLKTSVKADPTLVGDRISLDRFNTSFFSELGAFAVEGGSMRLNVAIPGFTSGQQTILPPIPPTDIPSVTGDLAVHSERLPGKRERLAAHREPDAGGDEDRESHHGCE